MPTYKVTGINIGTFNLGESDKLLTIFTAEKGLIKGVAKGARKPGSKISGRAEVLTVNSLMMSTGRSLDIISQAQTIETFPGLRHDLTRLSMGLYYLELTRHFAQGLTDESESYLEFLRSALKQLSDGQEDPAWLCLKFETTLLDILGYKPELTFCVLCRDALTDFKLGAFHQAWGGVVCRNCIDASRTAKVSEDANINWDNLEGVKEAKAAIQITPLVWKYLLLASNSDNGTEQPQPQRSLQQSVVAAHRLVKHYLEHRAGRPMKSLELVEIFR